MKKITKKQRKAARGPNAAVLHSLKNGEPNGDYIGDTPFYRRTLDPSRIVKVSRGIPFVRADRWGTPA